MVCTVHGMSPGMLAQDMLLVCAAGRGTVARRACSLCIIVCMLPNMLAQGRTLPCEVARGAGASGMQATDVQSFGSVTDFNDVYIHVHACFT